MNGVQMDASAPNGECPSTELSSTPEGAGSNTESTETLQTEGTSEEGLTGSDPPELSVSTEKKVQAKNQQKNGAVWIELTDRREEEEDIEKETRQFHLATSASTMVQADFMEGILDRVHKDVKMEDILPLIPRVQGEINDNIEEKEILVDHRDEELAKEKEEDDETNEEPRKPALFCKLCPVCIVTKEGYGLHFSIIATFVSLVAICTIILTVTAAVINSDTRNLFHENCQDIIKETLNSSFLSQLENTQSLTGGVIASASRTMMGELTLEANQIAGTASTVLWSLNYANATGDVVDDTLGAFSFLQLTSSFNAFVDSTSLINATSIAVGSEMQLTEFVQQKSNPVIPSEVVAILQYTGLYFPSGKVQCSLRNKANDILRDCSQNISLSQINFSPFYTQQSFPKQNISKSTWSNLYHIFSRDGNGTSPVNEWQYSYGVTFSWPINIPTNTYKDFTGIFSASVPAYRISQFCKDRVIALKDATLEEARIPNVALYVVVANNSDTTPGIENQSGWFVGGAQGDKPLPSGYGYTAVDFYNQTKTGMLVEWTSRSILQSLNVANFNDPIFAIPQNLLLNQSSGKPCILELHDGELEFETQVCFLVVVTPCKSKAVDHRMAESYSLDWLMVFAAPLDSLLNNFSDTVERAQQNYAQIKETTDSIANKSLSVSVTVTVLCIVVTFIAAWYLSAALVRSIKDLENFVNRVRRLEFGIGFSSLPKFKPSKLREVHSLQRAFSSTYTTLDTFSRFIPAPVVRRFTALRKPIYIEGRNVTIMFSDIQGFTTIAEELDVKDLMYLITKYLTVMTNIVEAYEGVVAEIQGDGLLAFFNTPVDVEDHCSKALAAALAQQEFIKVLSQRFREEFGHKYSKTLSDFRVRIGIHTGSVLSGTFGSELKMKWGCISKHLNSCSRLEGLCKLYGVAILCSDATLFGSKNRSAFLTREMDEVVVKGSNKPMRIFQVLAQRIPLTISFSARIAFEGEEEEVSTASRFLGRIKSKLTGRGTRNDLSQRAKNKSLNGEPPSSEESSRAAHIPLESELHLIHSSKLMDGKFNLLQQRDPKSFNPTPLSVEEIEHLEAYVMVYETAHRAFCKGSFMEALCLLNDTEGVRNLDPAECYLRDRILCELDRTGGKDNEDPHWNGINKLSEKNF